MAEAPLRRPTTVPAPVFCIGRLYRRAKRLIRATKNEKSRLATTHAGQGMLDLGLPVEPSADVSYRSPVLFLPVSI